MEAEQNTVKLKRFVNKLDNLGRSSINCLTIFCGLEKNNRLLFAGCSDGIVRVWNLLDGVYKCSFENFHEKEIKAIAVHNPTDVNDVPYLITGSEDEIENKKLVVWNAVTREYYCSLFIAEGHKKVLCVATYRPSLSSSTDPTYGLSAGSDKIIFLWDLNNKTYLRKFGGTENRYFHTDLILSLAIYEPKSDAESKLNICTTQLISASWDKSVIYWDFITGLPTHKLTGHTKSVTSVIVVNPISTKDKYVCPLIITTSLDKTAIVWDLLSGEKIRKFEGHTEKIVAAAFVQKTVDTGPLLITCGDDKRAIIFDLLTGQIVRELKDFHSDKINSVVALCQPDIEGLLITTASKDNSIIWNFMKKDRTRTLNAKAMVTCVAMFTNKYYNEPQVVVATVDNSCSIFDFVTADLRSESYIDKALGRQPRNNKLIGHKDRVNAVVVLEHDNDHAKPLAITGSTDCTAIVWSLLTGEIIQILKNHTKMIFPIALYVPCDSANRLDSVENRLKTCILTGSLDYLVKVWQLKDTPTNQFGIEFEFTKDLVGHDGMVRAISVYSPANGTTPYVISGAYDTTAIVWNLRTYEKVHVLAGQHSGNIFAVAVVEPFNFKMDDSLMISSVPKLENENQKMDNITTNRDSISPKRSSITPGKLQRSPTTRRLSIVENNQENPIAITGGYDGKTVIWNMLTGKHINTLYEHTESVTSLATYISPTNPTKPILITGSIDRGIILWDLSNYSVIDKLVGHKDRLMSIIVYNPCKADGQQGEPILITGSDDQTSIIWEDTLHSSHFMPLSDSVERAFEFDEIEEDRWHLITSLCIKYGVGLFVENANLFNLAVIKMRSDFLLQFREMLCYVIRFVPSKCASLLNINNQTDVREATMRTEMSLLRRAIEKKNLDCLRIILECWIENLNTDMTNRLDERIFHASYYLDTKTDLVALAEIYPSEFIKFICAIRLIKSHHHVNDTVLTRNLQSEYNRCLIFATDRDYITSNDLSAKYHADLRASKNDSQAQPVISMMLPLKDAANFLMLDVYQIISNELDDVSIFKSEVGIYTFRYVWDKSIQDAHYALIYRYAGFLLLLTITVLKFDDSLTKNGVIELFHLFVIILAGYYLREEWFQMMKNADAKKDILLNNININYRKYLSEPYKLTLLAIHFYDFWNFIDLVVVLTVFFGFVARLFLHRDSVVSRCLLSITVIAAWFKVLYFLRPFESSGPLVSMILQIVKDLKFFLVVLSSVLFGFTQAFWLLGYPDKNVMFWNSLLNTFMYMLGEGLTTKFEETHSYFSIFILIMFMSIVPLLMLNVLIALMGESFSNVRAKGSAQWRLEQASIILEEQFLLTENENKIGQFIHVIKYTSDISNHANSINSSIKVHQQIEELKRNYMKKNKQNKIKVNDERMDELEDKIDQIFDLINNNNNHNIFDQQLILHV
eukprot:gene4170-5935_t